MKNNKKEAAAIVIAKRDLAAYFQSPIAYIVTGLFLLAMGFLFFNTFFLNNRAELRNFFGLLPILLSFFIPALTMRVIAEEKRSGSIETLMTLPVTAFDVTLGKFLAAFGAGALMLAPTLFYAITCAIFGDPDWGPIVGGYLGALFLTAAFSAIGIFASASTKNQIVAFFIALAICMVLTLLSMFAVFLPSSIVEAVSYLSASTHFESISRGILDTRDFVYFLSLTALFFAMTVQTIKATGDNR